MRHKFPKVHVAQGEGQIEIACVHCGAKAIVYESGARAYLNEKGNKTPFASPCSTTTVVEQGTVILESLPKDYKKIDEIVANKMFKEPTNFAFNRLSSLEASYKDALTIIKIMYDDLLSLGAKTQGVMMARGLLQSKGYAAFVEELDRRTNN